MRAVRTPREEAHTFPVDMVDCAAFFTGGPHTPECNAATEAISNARADGAAVALLEYVGQGKIDDVLPLVSGPQKRTVARLGIAMALFRSKCREAFA